jgi:hypothetical protein
MIICSRYCHSSLNTTMRSLDVIFINLNYNPISLPRNTLPQSTWKTLLKRPENTQNSGTVGKFSCGQMGFLQRNFSRLSSWLSTNPYPTSLPLSWWCSYPSPLHLHLNLSRLVFLFVSQLEFCFRFLVLSIYIVCILSIANIWIVNNNKNIWKI